jgi:hypothetical protein
MKSQTISRDHQECHTSAKKIDFLLWGIFSFIFICYVLEIFLPEVAAAEIKINLVISSVYVLVNLRGNNGFKRCYPFMEDCTVFTFGHVTADNIHCIIAQHGLNRLIFIVLTSRIHPGGNYF